MGTATLTASDEEKGAPSAVLRETATTRNHSFDTFSVFLSLIDSTVDVKDCLRGNSGRS